MCGASLTTAQGGPRVGVGIPSGGSSWPRDLGSPGARQPGRGVGAVRAELRAGPELSRAGRNCPPALSCVTSGLGLAPESSAWHSGQRDGRMRDESA